MLTLDIQSTDSCYEWLLEWLAEQPQLQKSRRLGVESSYVASRENAVRSSHSSPIIMLPAPYRSHSSVRSPTYLRSALLSPPLSISSHNFCSYINR